MPIAARPDATRRRQAWRCSRWASSTATSAPARCTPPRKRSIPQHGIPLTRREHPGRRLGDLLGADDRRLAQVRDARAARQQPRRGRHHGAARARERRRCATGRACGAALLAIGVFGAALFYGDAVLTPAISVLSAVEGLEVGTAAFKPYVVPIAVGHPGRAVRDPEARHGRRRPAVRAGVRCCGSRRSAQSASGTSRRRPAILAALDPSHALRFATAHGFASFVVLGSVLLAITGAEALYADMGHFGKRAIRIAWFGVAAPALVLNYFGQGALLIDAAGGDREPVLSRLSRRGRSIRWSRWRRRRP